MLTRNETSVVSRRQRLSGSGTNYHKRASVNSKVQGISDRLKPTIIKQLRSYLGAVIQFNKFIPDLAKICFPFRTLLKKDTHWERKNEHDKTFEQINNEIKPVTILNHFKKDCPLRIICDASKLG